MGRLAKVGHAKLLKTAKSLTPPLGTTAFRAQSLQIESIGALTFWWRMIFSENRFPLFRIMR